MKLHLEKLDLHFKKTLAPIYLISGDEILLVEEAANNIQKAAYQKGYTEKHRFYVQPSFDWQQLLSATENFSLFSDKQLIEIQISDTKKLGKIGSKILQNLADNSSDQQLILIITGKIDANIQKGAWFKAIDKQGVILSIWPIDREQLPQWISQRLKQVGFSTTQEGLQLFVSRTEGNLLATKQEIEKLTLLHEPGHLTTDQIAESVFDNARFNLFAFTDSCLQGDINRTLCMLNSLKTEAIEPNLILWALAREIRSLAIMKKSIEEGETTDQVLYQNHVWEKRKSIIKQALHRHTTVKWQQFLMQCAALDRVIKGTKAGNVWDELTTLSLSISISSH